MNIRLVVISIMITLLAGCETAGVESTASILNNADIQLSVNDVSVDGLTYTITNNSKDTCTFGEEYQIERFMCDGWYVVDEQANTDGELAWSLVLYVVEPGKQQKMDADWQYRYGKLPAGNYRLLKTIEDVGTVAATFEITE